ncbi:MAG: B12-binding domain-containing radical SAM protein [Elusimicrobia bacterium]|nr:B12-binding domain-containing radical SAM protein [Elusimicrobiota bacterium]
MKILLVNPPVNRLCDNEVNYFPLGLGYLAAITNRAGFETRIYNAELETQKPPILTNRRRINNHGLFIKSLEDDSHRVWLEFREVMKKLRPDIVGFSGTSASILPCLKMAEDAKKIYAPIVVIGGIHPTILPEETVRSKNVDYIIAGDGEKSFPAFLKALAEKKEPLGIPGVGAWRDGGFVFTPPEPVDRDIDSFPFPDRDSLVNLDKHKNFLQAIMTSRGCPYNCTFCSGRNITGGLVRYRSPENVVAEIKFLKDRYKTNHIMFYDDMLLVNKKRIHEICELIIGQKLNITWGAFTRADSVDKETLAVLKASGCRSLSAGVESGSDSTLEKINKGYTREQAINGVRLIKEAGIIPYINMIIGFPHETERDIRDSISLIRELNVSTNINTFTPYPKSDLYDECIRSGLIKGNMDWASFSQHSPHNEFIREVSHETYRVLLDEMLTAADDIITKKHSGLFNHLKRTGEIWHEENRNAFRFTKVMLGKIKTKFKQVLSE